MPILDEHTLDFVSHSPDQTRRLGLRLGPLLQAGDIICLEGELGSGKTCLAQGVGEGMGVSAPITSPTFILIAEYRLPPPTPTLYHIDLYRIGKESEIAELGWEDHLGQGVIVVEWAEKLKYERSAIRVKISIDNTDRRTIIIER